MSLNDATFAGLMEALGPFEATPRLAVGVSGGADSLALALLADAWVRHRGGTVTALTVDHGLRPEAAAEAAQVGRWMEGQGIAHAVLRGTVAAPARNVQAQARELRHGLLRGWCRDNGVLHLLLAHHREDQAETVLLRLARGSGATGLAGMAAVTWAPEVRVLRPLLGVPRSANEAFLASRGQDWVRDPSNEDTAYGRVRMRHLLPLLAAEGADAARLAETAQRLGRSRQTLDALTADLLAAAVSPHPAGFAWVEPEAFRAVSPDIALRALRTVLAAVGGRSFGPRAERAEAALATLGRGPGTLGGCRLVPQRDGRLLVVREVRDLPVIDLGAGEVTLWDGRFRVALKAATPAGKVGPLGLEGWAQVREHVRTALPAAARASVPALWRDGRVIAVPALSYPARTAEFRAEWAPRQVLLSGTFRLAPVPSSII